MKMTLILISLYVKRAKIPEKIRKTLKNAKNAKKPVFQNEKMRKNKSAMRKNAKNAKKT